MKIINIHPEIRLQEMAQEMYNGRRKILLTSNNTFGSSIGETLNYAESSRVLSTELNFAKREVEIPCLLY